MSEARMIEGGKTAKRGSRARGFTLIEMLVVVAIMALLMRLAAPSFSEFMGDARMTANSEALVGALNYARSEAAMRGVPVTVRALDPAGPGGRDWRNGAEVILSDGATPLRQIGPMSPMGRTPVGSLAGLAQVTFNPDGSMNLNNGAWMRLCDGRAGRPGRVISINGAGYVTVFPSRVSGGAGASAACV